MITIPICMPQGRTNFSTWDRQVLESFARQAADENRMLRAALASTPAADPDSPLETGEGDALAPVPRAAADSTGVQA